MKSSLRWLSQRSELVHISWTSYLSARGGYREATGIRRPPFRVRQRVGPGSKGLQTSSDSPTVPAPCRRPRRTFSNLAIRSAKMLSDPSGTSFFSPCDPSKHFFSLLELSRTPSGTIFYRFSGRKRSELDFALIWSLSWPPSGTTNH